MTPANPCPICGQPIPEREKGSRHGLPPKTCSETCRKERNRRLATERYHRVKGSDEWKATRKAYLQKLRDRLDKDAEFSAIFRAEAAARQREWYAKLQSEESERHAQLKAEKRAERAAWHQTLVNDPNAWKAHRAKCRAWYQSLSAEERDRIFNEPRRQRARQSK